MPRRIDAGPALAALGALLLLVSLFLDWFGRASGWAVFELVDLVLAGLAVAALLAAAERGIERRWLPAIGAAALVVVAVQLFEPPPAARGGDRDTGAWVALAGALLLAIGGVLTTAAVSVSVQVRGAADPARRRRVSAVDRRAADGPAGHPREERTAVVPVADDPGPDVATRIPAVDRRPDAGASSSLFGPITDDVTRTQPMPTGEHPVEDRP